MRLFVVLTAAAAAAATLAAASQAALPASARTLMAHRETITPSRELALANRTVKHARDVLGFLKQNPMCGTPRSRMRVQRDHRWLLRFGLAEQERARARMVPAHHALWECIHEGEAGWHQPSHAVDAHGVPLYWGGMQMHAGWGYGTSYHASDDSELVQEQSAESAYRASGWSTAWLWGQWAADYGRCSGYA
jgi:hypothetical protein